MSSERLLVRLNLLLHRLNTDLAVSNRDLKNALTEPQNTEMIEMWENQKAARSQKKPLAVTEYERRLRIVSAANARYERIQKVRLQKNVDLATKMGGKVQQLCEQLIEYFEHIAPQYSNWFDRHNVENISLDYTSLPRIVTSRSHHAHKCVMQQLTKRDIKIIALENAIKEIETPTTICPIEELKATLKPNEKRNFEPDTFKGFKV